MEIIIVTVVILICCMILNVSPDYMLLGSTLVMSIFFGLLAVGFAYCSITLLFSKRKEAGFLRFDKVGDSRYQVAYYLVEGEEYPCAFPKELFMQDKLYPADKTCHVMLNKKIGKVYDRFAVTTCVAGLVLSVVFCIVMIMFHVSVR